ncbi:hypothetical protein MMC09_005156 [Bachmanniomyces sp. S44760]|nr:hypothetical protein [Bachmanniomyces sp. S44760]
MTAPRQFAAVLSRACRTATPSHTLISWDRLQNVWLTARRRSQNIKMAFLLDLLDVVDQAAAGRAPNMTMLTNVMARPPSRSLTPTHATNGVLAPERVEIRNATSPSVVLTFSSVEKRMIK